VNTDVTKVRAKGGLHRAEGLAIESVSFMTGSIDRRFDIRRDGGGVPGLTADGKNPLHVTVAIDPLHRKQCVRRLGKATPGDAVQSVGMAGQ